MSSLKNEYTFIKGAALSSELVVVSAVVDDLGLRSATQLYGWLGDEWYDLGTYGLNTCGLTILENPETIICVGDSGDVVIAKRGGIRVNEKIGTNEYSPLKFGKLRSTCVVDGMPIVAGMGRQVYMRASEDNWEPIGESNFGLEDKPVGFEGVDGFSLIDIYCVGWHGEIWQYNSTNWVKKSSPTNQTLTDVCCGGDGNVYACGRRGLLIVGRDDQWNVIDQLDTIEDFWSMAWFGGELYISTMRAVYTLKGQQLSIVDFGDDIPLTCYDLSVSDNVICSVGEKDVMLFNKDSWIRLD